MKTGYTSSAGYCLVATAKKNSMRLIAVVTGAKTNEDRNNSAYALLNYGFRFFEKQTLIEKGKSYGKAKIWKGTKDTVELVANENVVKTITKGISKDIEKQVDIFEPIIAPVNLTDPIGKLTLTYEDKVLAESPLYAKKSIEQDSLWGWLYDSALLILEKN